MILKRKPDSVFSITSDGTAASLMKLNIQPQLPRQRGILEKESRGLQNSKHTNVIDFNKQFFHILPPGATVL
jgi:hypothetical protein